MKIILAPKSSSKRFFTELKRLSFLQKFNFILLSKILRDNKKNENEIWTKINRKLNLGELVENQDICEVVAEKIITDNQENNIILGFPKNNEQFKILKKLLEDREVNSTFSGILLPTKGVGIDKDQIILDFKDSLLENANYFEEILLDDFILYKVKGNIIN